MENGNIYYISIDGKEVPSSDYNDNKTMFTQNEKREITSWKHTVRIKPYVIQALATGSHKIAIVCAGQKYTTSDKVLVDSVTFNLIDITNPSIALNKTSLNVVRGDSDSFTATILPTNAANKAVTWKSSNTAVATVDSTGKVTGVTVGTATITCTANDGSGKYSTCAITVTNPIVFVAQIRERDSTELATLILPTIATNKGVTWKSSNPLVATVDANGKITGVKQGDVTITCTANDESGKSATCFVSVINGFLY